MLQAFGLSFEPDPRIGPLFENLSLSIHPGEVVGLVGRNGTGKTKLIEILAGKLIPHSGHVACSGTIGFLPQDFPLDFDGTVTDLLGDSPSLRKLLPRLAIGTRMLSQPYQSLSLGEKTRIHLALALSMDPEILLLDEPTNHLDAEGRAWLEKTIQSWGGGALLVAHDRAMLDTLADRVLELENGRLTEFSGGYSSMQREKARLRNCQTAQYARQGKEAKRLLSAAEETLKKARSVTERPTGRTYDPKAKAFYSGKAGRMDKRARSIRQRVEHAKAHQVDKPYDEQPTELVFPSRPLRSQVPLTVRGLSKTFDTPIFTNLNLTLERDARIAVIGHNGAGKTTLFRLLLGEETPDLGTIEWAPDAVLAYLSQDRAKLDPRASVLKAIDPQGKDEETFVRTLLARLHMRRQDVDSIIGDLSVGERTKVEIVSLLKSETNVLLLDEPTNHLDIPSLEALEGALKAFPGCVIFTSHDRRFVEQVATEILELSQ